MVPLLIEAIKAQQKTIDTLTSEIKEIKEFLSSLKNN
jgi:prefoldin subunit 5